MQSSLERAIFDRTELLFGREMMERIENAKVIIFGVGGVGSWCAEGLVRSGIRHLTIVDSDRICVTNVNRQLMATTATLGQVKVEAMKARLLEINPKAEITAIQKTYTEETCHEFGLDGYDYIIDCIDSLKDKISLLLRASATKAVLFSSMGAAVKVDPTKIRVSEFWDVRGCPLGSAIRKRMRQQKTLPAKPFLCVYDEEVLPNKGEYDGCICPKLESDADGPQLKKESWCSAKARVNGTTAHITGIFGFTLSGLLLQDLYEKS